ncbi:MAG: family 16 glycoside hydrolase [Pirellulales bacterium]
MKFSTPSAIQRFFQCVILCGAIVRLCFGNEVAFTSGLFQEEDKVAALQGEYTGTQIGVQVVALGNDEYEVNLFQGGLPSAGWDRTSPTQVEVDEASLVALIDNRKLQKIVRQSPTLGARVPEGGLVLFDGSLETLQKQWNDGAQKTDDGLLMPGATTRQRFRDYRLHVEFQTPLQPSASGQKRGNSGVYHQGRYETQILDSFGLEGKNNEAGGIYGVRDPDINMCFPPLSWQTYDVDFEAARFDGQGKKTQHAKLTVRLNGVVVHSAVDVPNPTAAAPFPEDSSPGPIHLQDHGNPVRFRNIWIVERDMEADSLRPRVVAYEREHASHPSSVADSDGHHDAMGGRLLVAHLGCVRCHASPNTPWAGMTKRAPNLDQLGSRIRFDYLVEWIRDPLHAKPGTTMPDMLHGLSQPEKDHRALAIASYLAGDSIPIDRPGDGKALERGKKLYREIGCAACHDPDAHNSSPGPSSVPLGDLTRKYTVDSLTHFLLDPHQIRPSGFMPKMVQDWTEARDLACYLLGESILGAGVEAFQAKVFYGTWDRLPNFDEQEVKKEVTTRGLDLQIAGRKDHFGIRFDAFLPVERDSEYTFRIGSDDGSRLLVDDREIVRVDGIHPMQHREAKVKLTSGMHRIRIEYFENSGGEELEVDVATEGLGRVPLAVLVSATADSNGGKELIPSRLHPDKSLVEEGRKWYRELGCGQCHATQEKVKWSRNLPKLNELNLDHGCLQAKPSAEVPLYGLTREQIASIRKTLESKKGGLEPATAIHMQMLSRNCIACHQRDGVGAPEAARDALFLTSVQEMGNEGRLPPPLNGVGDKLRLEYLKKVLSEGAKERPYMTTRMPGFGKGHLDMFAVHLARIDQQQASQASHTALEDASSMVSTGRKLVGSDGLACVKCHRYGNKSVGIGAIDLKRTSERIRDDWFVRYLLNPTQYRPGTRMPNSFPEGKSVLTSVYDGDAHRQIQAMWKYLESKDAKEPLGVDGASIVLKPIDHPILYRNFIEGLGPRGIGVGYPEQINIAWDAGTMSLARIWQNEFLDASKHWVGRGPGYQGPLGDHVVSFEKRIPIARLDSMDAAWPKEAARELGVRFIGYRLDAQKRPIFRYRIAECEVEEVLVPKQVEGQDKKEILRTFRLKRTSDAPIYLRLPVLDWKSSDGKTFVGPGIELQLEGGELQQVKTAEGTEWRMSIPKEEHSIIQQRIRW